MFVDSLHIFSFFLLTFATILLTFLMKTSRVETRSLPALARCYPRSFTFYVAHPARSILTSSFFLLPFFCASAVTPQSEQASGITAIVQKAMKTEHLRARSEEHTSELQSRGHLVCRLL